MNVLALETSGTSGSVALWTGDASTEPKQWLLPTDVRNARSLAPAIETALSEFGWKPAEVKLVTVTSGPGSFTGLRVGVVTAKAFAFSVGCPVVGVNTLGVIARQGLSPTQSAVTAVMDAQRGELFVAKWSCHPTFVEAQSTDVMPANAWLSGLQPGESVTGPGLAKLADKIPSQVRVVDSTHWQPQAATVAKLGYEAWQNCADRSSFDPFLLVPQYFRRTAAEEQWESAHRPQRLLATCRTQFVSPHGVSLDPIRLAACDLMT